MESIKDYYVEKGLVFEKKLSLNDKYYVFLIVPYLEPLKMESFSLSVFYAELDPTTKQLKHFPKFIDFENVLEVPATDKDLKNVINSNAESIVNSIRIKNKKNGLFTQKQFEDFSIEKWNSFNLMEIDYSYDIYKDFYKIIEIGVQQSNLKEYLEYLRTTFSKKIFD